MSQQQPGDYPPGADRPSGSFPGQPAGPAGQVPPGQPYPGQSYPGQPYPGQPYPGQSYPGQSSAPHPSAVQTYPGQPPYFQPQPAIPSLPKVAYAPWGRRALASLIDFAPTIVGAIVYLVGYAAMMATAFSDLSDTAGPPSFATFLNPGVVVGIVIMIAAFPWNLYNRWIKGGKTGQSLGKRVMKISLLSEQTGAPVGAGMAFLRDVVHGLDGAAFYIGYLWPLWDEKRQTFADKLMQTVVLPAPDAGPASPAPAPYPHAQP